MSQIWSKTLFCKSTFLIDMSVRVRPFVERIPKHAIPAAPTRSPAIAQPKPKELQLFTTLPFTSSEE